MIQNINQKILSFKINILTILTILTIISVFKEILIIIRIIITSLKIYQITKTTFIVMKNI
jgi:hypothetical protein